MNGIAIAKANLKAILQKHQGNTQQASVINVVEQLVRLNPTAAPAQHRELCDGH